jgi:hypothetical protein
VSVVQLGKMVKGMSGALGLVSSGNKVRFFALCDRLSSVYCKFVWMSWCLLPLPLFIGDSFHPTYAM